MKWIRWNIAHSSLRLVFFEKYQREDPQHLWFHDISGAPDHQLDFAEFCEILADDGDTWILLDEDDSAIALLYFYDCDEQQRVASAEIQLLDDDRLSTAAPALREKIIGWYQNSSTAVLYFFAIAHSLGSAILREIGMMQGGVLRRHMLSDAAELDLEMWYYCNVVQSERNTSCSDIKQKGKKLCLPPQRFK